MRLPEAIQRWHLWAVLRCKQFLLLYRAAWAEQGHGGKLHPDHAGGLNRTVLQVLIHKQLGAGSTQAHVTKL